MPPLELTEAELAAVLGRGVLEVQGRMRYASNGALFVVARADGVDVPAVYKPRRGERPLWDFPPGSLYRREVAAYEVDAALGWGIVPVTVLREDGPHGEGALQRFVEHDPDEHYFTLVADRADRFREFAVFDILVNNTDRKAGHCLRDLVSDRLVGIDHGLTFHPVDKLRTVIWDFAGEPIQPALAGAVAELLGRLGDDPFATRLAELVGEAGVEATERRAELLLAEGRLPFPDPDGYQVPWPLV